MRRRGLGALGQFVFGYTFFPFSYVPELGERLWSGGLPTPHTAMLVFWMSVLIIGLVIAAYRHAAPLSPPLGRAARLRPRAGTLRPAGPARNPVRRAERVAY